MTRRCAVAFTAYVLVATAANVATARLGLVPIGFGFAVTAGTFAAGAALLLRDALHESGPTWLVYLAVALGALLSAATAGPALALASAGAFAVSEGVDAVAYGALRERSRAGAVLVSGLVGAAADTAVFLWLAAFALTASTFAGQVAVKVALSALAALVIVARHRKRAEA